MIVSIVVVTYNSERYIIDTLESIKNQSYKNIELIVSDDKSKDNTVNLIDVWMKNNKVNFVNTKLITSNENTGVSANLNRGISEAKGKYIKTLAGDDILKKNAIEKYLDFVINNDYSVVFSDYEVFSDKFKNKIDKDKYNIKKEFFCLSIRDKYKNILVNNFIPAPTAFFNSNIFKKIGGFDESNRLFEDWPYWIKLLENNIDLKFIDEKLVCYRINDCSITNQNKVLYNINYYNELYKFFKNNRRKKMIKNKLFLHVIDSQLEFNYINSIIRSGNRVENINLYNKFIFWFNPFRIVRNIRNALKGD